jgi:hypothetical protein
VPVYLVRLRARGIRATLEDVERRYDFLKNEYVWAQSASEAIEKAQQSVRSELCAKPSIRQEDIAALDLDVDELLDHQSVLNLIKKQGFVFSPAEGGEDDADDGPPSS